MMSHLYRILPPRHRGRIVSAKRIGIVNAPRRPGEPVPRRRSKERPPAPPLRPQGRLVLPYSNAARLAMPRSMCRSLAHRRVASRCMPVQHQVTRIHMGLRSFRHRCRRPGPERWPYCSRSPHYLRRRTLRSRRRARWRLHSRKYLARGSCVFIHFFCEDVMGGAGAQALKASPVSARVAHPP